VVLTDKGGRHLAEAGTILRSLEAEWGARIGAEQLGSVRAHLATLVRAAAGETVPALRPVW